MEESTYGFHVAQTAHCSAVSPRLPDQNIAGIASDEERELLRFELNCALLHFLESDRPVFLEGLGIILPRLVTQKRTHLFDRWGLLRSESVRTFEFEKCEDLVGLHRNTFADLIETKDLAARIYPRLPLALHFRWTEVELRSIIRAFFRSVRDQLIKVGFSGEIRSVGILFALHNRQGTHPNDWFAGSNIVLKPRRQQTLRVGAGTIFERPILESSWEILGAAFGVACQYHDLDLSSALAKVGAVGDMSDRPPEGTLHVAVFCATQPDSPSQQRTLIYCTDGLRKGAKREGTSPRTGCELVIQIPHDTSEIPSWPFDALTLGWILLHSSPSGSLRTGVGLSAGSPLSGVPTSKISCILTTEFAIAPLEQMSADGSFCFINLVGICEDEALLVKKSKRSYLLSLLKAKGLDQVTVPNRNSILAKTHLAL